VINTVCGPAEVHGPLLRYMIYMTVTFPQVSKQTPQALKVTRCS